VKLVFNVIIIEGKCDDMMCLYAMTYGFYVQLQLHVSCYDYLCTLRL